MTGLPLPQHTSEYVTIPSSLTVELLAEAAARALGRTVAVTNCTTVNLCAASEERVSDSGATVLHLALDLGDGDTFDLAAKILSPDSTNIFKIDRAFDSRRWEVELMRWWGAQAIPQVPVVYDTRCNSPSREYWILYEFFPGGSLTADFTAHQDAEVLARHIAALHAHTRDRIQGLMRLTERNPRASLRSPELAVDDLVRVLGDRELTGIAGLTGEERGALADACNAIRRRPEWVDAWETVLVNRDFSARNTATRAAGSVSGGEQILVSFDWGAAHLGPAEEDFEVLLSRDFAGDPQGQRTLVREYVRAYEMLTGVTVPRDAFTARIPWARLACTLRYIGDHLESLAWMPWQGRSAYVIHAMIRGVQQTLGELVR